MSFILKRSFAGKVSAYIILLIMIIFGVIMALFYTVTRNKIITASVPYASSMLTNMSQQIDAQLQSVVHSINNTAWMIEANIARDDSIKSILRHNILNNPLIMGGSVAYEPDTLNGQECLKMIYAFQDTNGITVEEIGDERYYYPGMDWYLIPKHLKHSHWSEPYFDEGAGNIMMATYSRPLLNAAGEVYAVYTADVSLLRFAELVEKIQPFADSYSFMLSRNGYYITHRKKERLLRETIFSIARMENNPGYELVGHAMLAGKSGNQMFMNDKNPSYAIYAPVSSIGWSICNVGKQEVLLGALNAAARFIIIIFIAGIICFFLCTLLIIKRLMKPLEGFAVSAKEVAHGNFDAHLPDIRSEDEMKTLHDSFAYMQQSLTAYIAELQQTTASKEHIESELNIAHNIQMGMLPRIFPPFPERKDVELYAMLKPAKEVGGDLYDFFIMNDKLYFTVGDVSGKGVPASLFMAVTRTLFRNISRNTLSAAEIICQMNESISEQNDSNMFVTLFVGILDLHSGNLDYCNAGHNSPVLIAPDGRATLLKPAKNQLAVGVFSEIAYAGESILLDSDTKLFCYTDGVVEAENTRQELYSEECMLKTLSVHHHYDVKRLTEQMLESVADHVLTAEQSDDLTILVIKYKK